MRKWIVTCILSATTLVPLRAQHEVGIKPLGGFLLAHHTVMQYLVTGHAWGIECYYEKPVSGYKEWHNLYRNPEIGYMFFVGNPGNPQQMGWASAVVPYIKFHPVQRKVFHFNIKSGMGVGYLSKFFNRTENNKNTAIGSHFNIVFNMGFEPEWKIGRWDLGLGLSFIHYSNGAWKVPNLGYNMPMAHLNVGYRFGSQQNRADDVKNMDFRYALKWKKWTWQFALNAGIKEILPADGPKYGILCFSATALVKATPMSSFLFSSETYYNNAYHAALKKYYETDIPGADAIRSGLAVGYGLNIGRLILYLQNGFYVRTVYRDFDGSYFHRLGARYVFDNGLIIHGGLKTHFAKADNFELGVGYAIGRIKPPGRL